VDETDDKRYVDSLKKALSYKDEINRRREAYDTIFFTNEKSTHNIELMARDNMLGYFFSYGDNNEYAVQER